MKKILSGNYCIIQSGRNNLHIPLRERYSIPSNDMVRLSVLNELEKLGFIDIIKKSVVICNKCDRTIPNPDDNIEDSVRCPECKKQVSIHKAKIDYFIEKINYNNIIKKITELIENSKYSYEYDKENRYWRIKVREKIIPLMVPYISNSNFLIAHSEKEAVMFVILDSERVTSLINVMNKSQFIEFQKIYDNLVLFSETLEQISQTFDQNYALTIEPKFDNMLNQISAYEFEEFCVKFLKAIKENHEKLLSFYNYLNSRKETIINSKIIKLGGPGRSDFQLIGLLDYLQSGLRPELFGEAKKYKKTTFTIEDYSKAIIHADTNDTLFLVSTNNIQKEVWEKIHRSEKNGKYRFVLFDKDVILTLIRCLKLESIIGD